MMGKFVTLQFEQAGLRTELSVKEHPSNAMIAYTSLLFPKLAVGKR